MAKRVVVFDTKESPFVIVRKSKVSQNTTTKIASVSKIPAPQKMPPDYKTKFRDKLLADMRRALDNARQFMTDETRDQNYYSEKITFLENAIKALNFEEYSFAPLSEPFFWNEFKRIATIIAQGQKAELRVWRKAGNYWAMLLAKCMDSVRAGRDGWILKTPPLTVRDIVFFINGTMSHLDQPEKTDLSQLRQMYAKVYAKSGLEKEGAKFADLIRKKSLRKIWKNQDTVDYLLKNHPEINN